VYDVVKRIQRDGRFVNVINVGRKNLPTENKREMNTGKIKNGNINENIGPIDVVICPKIQMHVATEPLMSPMSRRNAF
jgi:phage antirepressor YoqD-like protein